MTRRELAALLIACGLHIAFLRVAGLVPDKNLLFERTPGPGEPVEVEIDREPTATEESAREPAPTPTEEASPRETDAEARAGAVDPTRPAAPAAAGDTAGVEEPGAQEPEGPTPDDGSASESGTAALPAPGSADEYGAPPEATPPSAGLGIGPRTWEMAGGLDLGPAPAAPTRAPAARALDASTPSQVIASTLRDADRASGITMPSTAVVTSAVSVATRSVPVPHNTRATFEVKLGPGGKVLSARVLKHSGGDKSQWDAAAKSVAASLAGRGLDIGQAKSATVLVNVTTKHVYPAGTSKAADVKPVCANQIINDLADGLDKNPDANPEPSVPLFQDENGRPCIPVGVAGVSDAANLGAQKQVQVQTSSTVLIDGKAALPASTPKINKDPFWVDTGKAGPRPVMPFKMRKYKRDKEKKK